MELHNPTFIYLFIVHLMYYEQMVKLVIWTLQNINNVTSIIKIYISSKKI